MADTLAAFNAYNFRTKVFTATTTLSEIFSVDDDKVYLVKVMHAVNISANPVTADVYFHCGEGGVDCKIYDAKSIAAHDHADLFGGAEGIMVVRGDLGDSLKIVADTTDVLKVHVVMMILGRDTGI